MRNQCQSYALGYVNMIEGLRQTARLYGYCLSVHGSMTTDLDLVASPWIDNVSDAETLINGICDRFGLSLMPASENEPNPCSKPHGRLTYTLWSGVENGPYLDVSVWPRLA